MKGFSLSVSTQKMILMGLVLSAGVTLVILGKLDSTNLVAFISGLVAALPVEDRKEAQ